jgi:hypothetical protein
MWQMHQIAQKCMLCHKDSDQHSEKLWQIHQSAIQEDAGRQKICEMTHGFGRKGAGVIKKWNMAERGTSANFRTEIIPIHMHCRECGLAVGTDEEDNADILDGLCTKCFCEETEQEYKSPFGEYLTGISKGLDLARDWRPS